MFTGLFKTSCNKTLSYMKSLLVLILIFLYGVAFPIPRNIPRENELRKVVHQLLNDIIHKNINGIVSLLPENHEIEIGIDSFVKKKEIIKELKSSGHIYNYLFDTDKHSEYMAVHTGKGKKYLCIRDQIINAKGKNLRIASISNYNDIINPPYADVRVMWDGQKIESDVLYQFVFGYLNGRWRLVNLLFTFP